jgi:hypothetical protein
MRIAAPRRGALTFGWSYEIIVGLIDRAKNLIMNWF